MKKFAKMLALGLALAMTFGMVVSAAENPSVVTKAPENVTVDSEACSENLYFVNPTAEEEEKVAEVAGKVADYLPSSFVNAKVLGTYYVESTNGEPVKLVINVGKVSTGEYYALHLKDDGTVEGIRLDKPASDGTLVINLTSCSPVMILTGDYQGNAPAAGSTTPATPDGAAPVSPKTGETLPVAGMMAVLCLAGALVCAKKARCNN